jgi:hypothetical protein
MRIAFLFCLESIGPIRLQKLILLPSPTTGGDQSMLLTIGWILKI